MEHTYVISGLTCGVCVTKVTKLLNESFKFQRINIDLTNKKITFTTDKEVNLDQINIDLKTIGNYHISAQENTVTQKLQPDDRHSAVLAVEDSLSYRPIYLIFAYLVVANLAIVFRFNSFIPDLMTNFMASFFLVFSFFKLLDIKGFAAGYSGYDIIAKRIYVYGYIYPFIEVFLGLGYIINGTSLYLNLINLIVMSISTIGVVYSKMHKQQIQCACVGTFLKVPLGNLALIEDLLMVVMSFIMLFRIL